jgi:hypothetical protein
MAHDATTTAGTGNTELVRVATSEHRLARYTLIGLALCFVGLFLSCRSQPCSRKPSAMALVSS